MGSSYVDSDDNLNWQLVISPTKRINFPETLQNPKISKIKIYFLLQIVTVL